MYKPQATKEEKHELTLSKDVAPIADALYKDLKLLGESRADFNNRFIGGLIINTYKQVELQKVEKVKQAEFKQQQQVLQEEFKDIV